MTIIETIKRYGLLGSIRLFRDKLLTVIFYPSARLIRYPFYIRGRSNILIGRGFTSGVGMRLDAFGSAKVQIEVGARVQVGDYVHIAAIESVRIEDDVLIASKVFISDHNHGVYDGSCQMSGPENAPYFRPLSSLPVTIEKNVWIGESVHVLPGVTIGAGSVIGAGAVVVTSVPPGSIAVGNPARVIRRFNYVKNSWERVIGGGHG